MNLFILDKNPQIAAQYHCDIHCSKMCLETAQLLSTAHRVLDGRVTRGLSKNGRKQTIYKLTDTIKDELLYKATHVNHPSSVWVRESVENYSWAYKLFMYLSNEYEKRYNKQHLSWNKLRDKLLIPPANIAKKELTAFKLAMPEEYKSSCPVESYRLYYKKDKARFAKWDKLNNIPEWWLV